MVAFEAMAVSTAMPVVARDLGGLRGYGLAFSLFLTASLLGIVLAGSWTDARGPLRPILAGLGLFVVGLLVAGTATSFGVLLAGRAVSGLGGGLEIVSLYVLVALVYPEPLQPRVFGIVSAAWVLPSLLGPPVAGFLATEVSWRAVFLVVVPMVLAPLPLLVARLRRLETATPDVEPDLEPDVEGVSRAGTRSRALHGVLLAAGALAFQSGLQLPRGVPAPVAVGPVLAAAGLVAVLLAVPALLPTGTLRLARGLASLVVVRGLFTATYFGAETFIPLMLVTQRGLSPALAGLTLTTGAVGWSAGSLLQGRGGLPISRPALLSLGGAVLGGCVLVLVPTPLSAVPVWTTAVVWAVGGVGMGAGMSSMSVLTLRLSAPGEEGRSSAALQICDALGGVLGVAAAGAVFAALHDPGGSDAGAFALIWVLLGAVGLLSALVALRVRQPSGPADTGPTDTTARPADRGLGAGESNPDSG